jgi:hypothetical protein
MYDRGVEMVIADFGWWEGSRPGIIDKLTQLRGLLSEVRHRKREIMENTNISKTVAFHMIGPIGRWGQQQFVVETWKDLMNKGSGCNGPCLPNPAT